MEEERERISQQQIASPSPVSVTDKKAVAVEVLKELIASYTKTRDTMKSLTPPPPTESIEKQLEALQDALAITQACQWG